MTAKVSSNQFKQLLEGEFPGSKLVDDVDKKLKEVAVLEQFAQKTEIRPTFVLLLVAVLVCIFFGLLTQFLSFLVGFLYPAWMSFKAVESPKKNDDTLWLTYWVVFAFVTFLEMFFDLFLQYIPFYFLFKVALLLWLSLPHFKGAVTVYNNFLRSFMLRYTKKVEGIMNDARYERRS